MVIIMMASKAFLILLLLIVAVLLKLTAGADVAGSSISNSTTQVEESSSRRSISSNNDNNNNNNNNDTTAEPRMNFPRRILGRECTSRDISIEQSRESSSRGIPEFTVQILSTCLDDCSPSNIHLNCGWFASADAVNPRVFRRLSYNDCLVNSGLPLPRGQILRFTYQNSFTYPITFKSARFC